MPSCNSHESCACTILLFVLTSSFALAQVSSELPDAPKPAPTAARPTRNIGIKYIAVRLVKDQRDIYTAPFRPSNYQAKYIIPFVIVAAFIPADRYLLRISAHQGLQRRHYILQRRFGQYRRRRLPASFSTAPWRTTITPVKLDCSPPKASPNSAALYAVTNVIAGRQRPNEGNGHGDFFQNNALDSSFPSGHATLQFSMSSVLAHEYPSLGSKFLWYGLGTAVAASRVVGRDHFPSDVIMGGTLGYLVGTAHLSRSQQPRDPKRQTTH